MHFWFYKDTKGEWRWSFKGDNNKILADSGEGYQNRVDCIDAIRLIKNGAAAANVWDTSQNPPLSVSI